MATRTFHLRGEVKLTPCF